MKCSHGISNFLEKIPSLSHSIAFLCFFALITEEGFLISPCYSLDSAFKWVYRFFSLSLFASLLFTAIYKASSDNHFAFLHFFFMGMVLIPVSCTMSRTSFHSSSGTEALQCSPTKVKPPHLRIKTLCRALIMFQPVSCDITSSHLWFPSSLCSFVSSLLSFIPLLPPGSDFFLSNPPHTRSCQDHFGH